MKTRTRFLAIAAATAAAVTALSGCSSQATPESVVLEFSQAFMTNNGKLPSEFMCEGAPKDEADGARWTTDLATEVRTGSAGEIDSDGYQIIETIYDREGQDDYTMGIKVDTRNLCVTDAGSHLSVDDGASEESDETDETESEPEESSYPEGSDSNPLKVADGATILFDDLYETHGEEFYLLAASGSTFTISGSSPLEIRETDGVEASQSDIGVEVVVSGSSGDWQSIGLFDADQGIGAFITVIVE